MWYTTRYKQKLGRCQADDDIIRWILVYLGSFMAYIFTGKHTETQMESH